MVTLYGISNCDSVRKARKWLTTHQIEHVFHDVRKDGLDTGRLTDWENKTGWETLLNRRGTTWRKLDDATKASINKPLALQLMLKEPTLIKRPVLEHNNKITVGFSETNYNSIFI
jgi:Spx/MgsR family transcriptional regulator